MTGEDPDRVGSEVELVSDGEGLAILGDPPAVERFIASVGLSGAGSPPTRELLRSGSTMAQTGSEIAAASGRWVKLTEESAQAVKQFGLTPTSTPGVSHAMVGQPGNIRQWVQVVKTPTSVATNPAVLAGAAGVMAQLAMQQQMDAIMDYLAVIDEKLDDVLRSQRNQVLARLDGVKLAVQEAMSIRSATGKVSEVTWSKVQASAQLIGEVQGYALRELEGLADKLSEGAKVGALADTAKKAEAEVQTWLTTLAHCIELHDAVGILELDRVLDAAPDEVEQHLVGLRAARSTRIAKIAGQTAHLLERMGAAVDVANSKVLFNPKQSPALVRASNTVALDVHEFHQLLGIESSPTSSDAKRWGEAASESLDKARATGGQGVDRVVKLGSQARGSASAAKGKAAERITGLRRKRNTDDSP